MLPSLSGRASRLVAAAVVPLLVLALLVLAPGAVPGADAGPASGVAQIAAGYEHSCSITKLDELYCWGRAQSGQLGFGASSTNQEFPRRVTHPDGRSWVSVTAGYQHSCAIDDLGDGWCWGDDGVDDASGKPRPSSPRLEPVASPREAAAAEYHARHERAVRAAQAAAARRMSGGMLSWAASGSVRAGDLEHDAGTIDHGHSAAEPEDESGVAPPRRRSLGSSVAVAQPPSGHASTRAGDDERTTLQSASLAGRSSGAWRPSTAPLHRRTAKPGDSPAGGGYGSRAAPRRGGPYHSRAPSVEPPDSQPRSQSVAGVRHPNGNAYNRTRDGVPVPTGVGRPQSSADVTRDLAWFLSSRGGGSARGGATSRSTVRGRASAQTHRTRGAGPAATAGAGGHTRSVSEQATSWWRQRGPGRDVVQQEGVSHHRRAVSRATARRSPSPVRAPQLLHPDDFHTERRGRSPQLGDTHDAGGWPPPDRSWRGRSGRSWNQDSTLPVHAEASGAGSDASGATDYDSGSDAGYGSEADVGIYVDDGTSDNDNDNDNDNDDDALYRRFGAAEHTFDDGGAEDPHVRLVQVLAAAARSGAHLAAKASPTRARAGVNDKEGSGRPSPEMNSKPASAASRTMRDPDPALLKPAPPAVVRPKSTQPAQLRPATQASVQSTKSDQLGVRAATATSARSPTPVRPTSALHMRRYNARRSSRLAKWATGAFTRVVSG